MSDAIVPLLLILVITFAACNDNPYPQGKRLYSFYCSNCHMEDGSGLNEMYPSLGSSDYLAEKKRELPCLIKNGKQGNILVTVNMPSNKGLTEAEMFNLVNYIHKTWGDGSSIPLNQLKRDIDNCDDTGQ